MSRTFRSLNQVAIAWSVLGFILFGWVYVGEAEVLHKIVVIAGALSLLCALSVSKLTASHAGVLVQNGIRRRPERWEEIEGFGISRVGRFPLFGFIELKGGERIRCWGILASKTSGGEAGRAVAELNDLLAQRSSHG